MERIKGTAISTHEQVVDTNRELREQRDIIIDANGKVVKTDE